MSKDPRQYVWWWRALRLWIQLLVEQGLELEAAQIFEDLTLQLGMGYMLVEARLRGL
jgi:hypothetical protein